MTPPKKILWLDTETTGTDSRRHSIIQIGCIVEVGGEVRVEQEFLFQPTGEVEKEALQVNGKTMEAVMAHPHAATSFREFVRFLEQWVDRYDRQDKFLIAGYNVDFDIQFLRAMFLEHGNRFFGAYFFWPSLDVKGTLVEEWERLPRMENFKLGTVCGGLGIELDAHDALNDIRATREVWRKLKGMGEGRWAHTY